MFFTDEQLKELTERLWKERVRYSRGGDPIVFRMHFDSAIREATEQASQPQVPDGYKLVPVEPTDLMVNLASRITPDHASREDWIVDIYLTMLEVAPKNAV